MKLILVDQFRKST